MNDNEERILSLPIQKSYEKNGEWIVEGFVSTDEVDSELFRMTKPALEDLVRDTKQLSTVLHNHLTEEEIGVVREAKVIKDEENPGVWGAWVKILISKTVPKIWQKIQEEVLSKFSIKGTADARLVNVDGKTISEAYAYRGAEVSIVSVPGLKTARILSYYVSKMKKGGFPMPQEDLEKVTMDAAKEAMKDLLDLDDTKWAGVEKILDLIDLTPVADVKKELDPGDVEKAWSTAMGKVVTGLKSLMGKVEDDLKKPVEDLIGLVEGVISEYPKSAEKAKEEEEEEEEEDEDLEKSKKVVEDFTKNVEEEIGKLPEENRAAFSVVLDALATLSKPVEKKKKKEEEQEQPDGKLSEEAVEKMSQTLAKVQKSITDATQKIESEQIVQMAETVVTLNTEVEKLSEIMAKKVPIRKGLSLEEKRRDEVKKSLSEDEEYQKLPAREKLAHLFGAIKSAE